MILLGTWIAEVINNPDDDFNLIIEISNDEKYYGRIIRVQDQIQLIWYPNIDESVVPVEWLLSLLVKAKAEL